MCSLGQNRNHWKYLWRSTSEQLMSLLYFWWFQWCSSCLKVRKTGLLPMGQHFESSAAGQCILNTSWWWKDVVALWLHWEEPKCDACYGMNEKAVAAQPCVHIQQSIQRRQYTVNDWIQSWWTCSRLVLLTSCFLFISLPSCSLFHHISLSCLLLFCLSLHPSFTLFSSSLPPSLWQGLSWPPVTQKQARLSWQHPVVHMKWCTFIFRCLPFKIISNGLTGTLVPESQIFLTLW